MLNEGFKSESSIPMQRHFLYSGKQQTPPGSMVARSWAHLPQSQAERQQCWDVFTNKLSYWLPSHTLCVAASTELSCCYLEPTAKLQQMQLKYTKLVLSGRSAWCNYPRGATQYWNAMKQPLYWGMSCSAGFGAIALHETFSTTSLFHFHTKASCQKAEEKLLFATQRRVVDKKETPFSKAGGRVPWVHCKPKMFALAPSPQKDWADFHVITHLLVLLCRLRFSRLEHKRLQSGILLLGRCCGSSQADIVP